jgi:hypothetical protein
MTDSHSVAGGDPAPARRARLGNATFSAIILGASYLFWFRLGAQPHDRPFSAFQIAGSIMLASGIYACIPLFRWSETSRKRRIQVWCGAILSALACFALGRIAGPPTGPLAQYGISVRSLMGLGIIVSIGVAAAFPVLWTLTALGERRRQDLVEFPSRGVRTARKPGS